MIFPGDRPQEFPELHEETEMRMRGDYIFEGASLYVDGRKVEGTIRCESGELPDCEDHIVVIELEDLPSIGGLTIEDINVVADNATMHLLQVQNPQGLFSNDFPFFVLTESNAARFGNILGRDGTIDQQGGWRANTSAGQVSWNGEAHFTIHQAIDRQPWRVSLEHDISVREGLPYSICYSAKSSAYRYIEVNVDTGPGGEQPYTGLVSTGIDPEVGGGVRNIGVSLNTEYRQFHHRFIANETDYTARLTFNLAQNVNDVWIDNVGVFYGKDCGEP